MKFEGGSAQEQNGPDCCCCTCCDYCQCKKLNRISKNETFCCCCPLVVGIWIIYIFIFSILFNLTLELIICAFNEYIDGSYVIVCFILLIPIYVAVGLFCVFLQSETKSGRKWTWIACLLALTTVVLYYVYTLYYFSNVYPYNDYYKGAGDKDDPDSHNYQRIKKKDFIVMQILVFVTLLILLIYSTFACYTWAQIADREE